MRKRLIFAIMVMGFSGLVAQILLLRELLIIFYGNELSIGIILANWLILEAFGCFFLGRRIGYFKRRIGAFVGLQLIFALCLPLAIYLIRTLKDIIGVSAGEGLGLIPMLCSSFLILLPISVSHGALFTFGCKLYSLYSSDKGRSLPDAWQAGASGSKQQGAQSIGKVYIYETIGTILGGIGLTYLLIPYFHSFQIAFGVSLLNIILCVYLLGPFWQKKQIATNKVLGILSGALLVVYAYLLFSPESDKLQQFSVNQQWKGQEVLHYQNSIYGNVVVTKREGQYTLFSDGIPVITSPVPDITFVEEFVHLPMLSHPQPKEILVISGGAGGLINEILKHPVERIDYAELDPLILEVVRRFPTALTEGELSDPRVNIKHIDGRLFVKTSLHKYDLVLVGLSNPSDLQVNRLFTKEFFSLVLKRLKEEGILVISLPGSLTYLSEELKNLNTCILNTLESIYPYVRVIPGDSTNLYLASTSPGVSLINHSQLSQRLKERKLNLSLLTPGHIEYKLHPRWLNWFLKSLEGSTEKINQDFQPSGLFYSLSYWNALFSPYMQGLFRWFENINLWLFFILVSIFTLVFLAIRSKIRSLANLSIPFCIVTTGFAGMIFDLALIFAFQALYGYVFNWIGLLVTAFMIGVTAGGLSMTRSLVRIRKDIKSFLKIELTIILFSGMLPVIFLILRPYIDRPAVFFCLQIIFLVLSLLSGFLIGAQFPLANKIYLGSSHDLSRTAGLLYGADLFGGWIGGIAGGVVLLPILGLFGACMVVAMLKASSLIIMATSARRLA